jgi:hypothetical protein
MNTTPPLHLYAPSRLSVVQMPVPTTPTLSPPTTQGGPLDEAELTDQTGAAEGWSDCFPDEPPVRADRARFVDQLAAQTTLAPRVATWTALCVHDRVEVTWFRAPRSVADHQDCGCPGAA